MKKKYDTLIIPKQDKEKSIQILRTYVEENFEVEVGNLQIEMLLDYMSENSENTIITEVLKILCLLCLKKLRIYI